MTIGKGTQGNEPKSWYKRNTLLKIGIVVLLLVIAFFIQSWVRRPRVEVPNVAGLDTPIVEVKDFLAEPCSLDGRKWCSTNPSVMWIEGDSTMIPVRNGRAKICADRPLDSEHFAFNNWEYFVGLLPSLNGENCVDLNVEKR